MAGQRVTTLDALRAVANGRYAPPPKYAALVRRGWVRIIGHGCGSRSVLTDAGRAVLSQGGRR